MKRFKKILLVADPVTDLSSAMKRAVQLVEQQQARLTVVDFSPDLSNALLDAAEVSDGLRSALLAEHSKSVQSMLSKHDAPPEIDRKSLVGIPFVEIIREVIRGKFDLVIKPTEGGGRWSAALGSTDMHLLRKCPCPVWIVKPTRRKKYQRILAAVDPDPKKAKGQLNKLIMDLATSLTDRERAELHVVSAWTMWRQDELGQRTHQTELEDLLAAFKSATKKSLQRIVEPYTTGNIKIHTHLAKGKPSDVILNQAKKHRIDLIVMGTVARVGIPGFFIGNTAERVLSAVECSVLAVKPEGFQTPIKL